MNDVIKTGGFIFIPSNDWFDKYEEEYIDAYEVECLHCVPYKSSSNVWQHQTACRYGIKNRP